MAKTPKTRCGGRWTEARYQGFIKNQLRSATRKWAPISDCLKKARTKRGHYLCNKCGKEVTTTKVINGRRVKNVSVDHVDPIVPVTGWVGWEDYINKMFCEEDNLQLLCKTCHDEKSALEQTQRKKYRKKV